VNVDPELKFSKHIEIQVNKANKILGLIRRSYEYMDEEMLKNLFTALVRPHLEFANVVWSPRLIKDTKLIEGVQRRATKLVNNLKSLSYEERLRSIDLPSLVFRRIRGDMIEAYKYTHGFYSTNSDLLNIAQNIYTRGHKLKLLKKSCKANARQNYFSNRVVNTWNKLPSSVVNAPSLNSFKAMLDNLWNDYKYSVELK